MVKKSHDLPEKPLKMANYKQYFGGHMQKSMKKIQEIRKFLSHTDWVCKCSRLLVGTHHSIPRPLVINTSYVL